MEIKVNFGETSRSLGANFGEFMEIPVGSSISIVPIENGNRVIIKDKDSEQFFDVLNGSDYTLTDEDKQELVAGFVKIMDKTITEDEAGVKTIKITANENGDPFSLKKIFCYIDLTAGEANANLSLTLLNPNGGNQYFVSYGSAANDKKWTIVSERISSGMWHNMFARGANQYARQFTTGYLSTQVDYANGLALTYTGSNGFPVGASIKIYGVKHYEDT